MFPKKRAPSTPSDSSAQRGASSCIPSKILINFIFRKVKEIKIASLNSPMPFSQEPKGGRVEWLTSLTPSKRRKPNTTKQKNINNQTIKHKPKSNKTGWRLGQSSQTKKEI